MTPSATAPEAKLPAEPPPVPPAAPSARADGRLGLSVVASSPTIAVGEVVTVDVVASAATAILDSPLHIDFDPRVLAYVDATPGQFLTQGGSSVVFIADGETHPGDAALALGRVQREMGASGTGLLCRVRLRGVSSGTTSVDVGEARAWGVSNDEVPVVVSAARVDVR